MTNIDFSKIETINVDVVIGFGAACRCAEALKRNHLRYFSSPFDWLMKYSLKTAYSILIRVHHKKKLKFFNNCYEDKKNSERRFASIVDSDCGMISMHDFPCSLPIEKAPKFFRLKYKGRFQNLDNILKSAKKVCFLTYRKISMNDMMAFVGKMKKLYKFEHIYFINIYDTEEESFEKFENDKETYMMYKFNDKHENGQDKATNPDFWKGNIEYWDKILSKIKLNKSFIRLYKIKRFIFHISNNLSDDNPSWNVTILGQHLKFKIKL